MCDVIVGINSMVPVFMIDDATCDGAGTGGDARPPSSNCDLTR
jgi:hypothetical protein